MSNTGKILELLASGEEHDHMISLMIDDLSQSGDSLAILMNSVIPELKQLSFPPKPTGYELRSLNIGDTVTFDLAKIHSQHD